MYLITNAWHKTCTYHAWRKICDKPNIIALYATGVHINQVRINNICTWTQMFAMDFFKLTYVANLMHSRVLILYIYCRFSWVFPQILHPNRNLSTRRATFTPTSRLLSHWTIICHFIWLSKVSLTTIWELF